MIIVSACLIGVECKYNGGCNNNPQVLEYIKGRQWVPVCPEQLGGLRTPRLAAEIINGSGEDVLQGKAKVITNEGSDVTAEFIKGAEETLRIARLVGATEAILKAKSPSCGNCKIYDGTFQRQTRDGSGVTAALLKINGIRVINEEEL